MNGMGDIMEERKENIHMQINAIKIGCMDEDDVVDGSVIKIGVAGSGITNDHGGNEELYPVTDRLNMKEAGTYIGKWVKYFSNKIGVPLYATSHPECGAGSAQGFDEESLIQATKQEYDANGINYAGHLKIADRPENTPDADVQSWFTRKHGEHHSASFINITVGGGVSGEEKSNMENAKGGKTFDISADWIGSSISEGFEKTGCVEALVFQFKLAYAIAEGVRNNPDPFEIFNAKRLDTKDAETNYGIAQEAVEIAKREIALGNWKAASHH